MVAKNSHCSWCGTPFAEAAPWPRACAACSNISYRNPLPVAVLLVPVGAQGLLLVRRNIEPQRGRVALPGGFIGLGESWQEAGVRELDEETGLKLDPATVSLYDTRSGTDGILLVFGIVPPLTRDELPPFVENEETMEVIVSDDPQELAFPTHDAVAARYWKERAAIMGKV